MDEVIMNIVTGNTPHIQYKGEDLDEGQFFYKILTEIVSDEGLDEKEVLKVLEELKDA